MGVGAEALARGVQAVDGAVELLVLGHPHVVGEDGDGQRAAGRPLGEGVKLGRGGVTGRRGDGDP